jgi:hypothetical protein
VVLVVETELGTLAARMPERREALDRRLAYVTPAS